MARKWKPANLSDVVKARSRKAFGRAVAASHGRARETKEADLRSRNAYRAAIGLPPVTLAK